MTTISPPEREVGSAAGITVSTLQNNFNVAKEEYPYEPLEKCQSATRSLSFSSAEGNDKMFVLLTVKMLHVHEMLPPGDLQAVTAEWLSRAGVCLQHGVEARHRCMTQSPTGCH